MAPLFALVLLAFVLAPRAEAQTLYHHPFITAFGPEGVGKPGKFKFTRATPTLGVDQGSHDVYVLAAASSLGDPDLFRFTATGEPDPFTAGPGAGTHKLSVGSPTNAPTSVAIAPPGAPAGTAGDVYVTVGGQVEVYSATGVHLGTIDGSGNPNPGFSQASRVTVDPTGNVYILYPPDAQHLDENPDGHLDKYVPSSNPPLNADFDSELRFDHSQATDAALSSTALYAYIFPSWFRYSLDAFPGADGSAVATPQGLPTRGAGSLATNPATGDVFASADETWFPFGAPSARTFGLDQYDDAGNWLSLIPLPNPEVDADVDGTTGKVYIPVKDPNVNERDVRIYGAGEPVQPPTAAVDPVTSVDFDSVHLTGTVNPGAVGPLQETAYRFVVCKEDCPSAEIRHSLADEEPERTLPGDGVDHLVSADVAGLDPQTQYEVVLFARNLTLHRAFRRATIESTITFETPAKPVAEPPQVTIDPVTVFDAETAHITGTVDPMGTGELQATTYRFEYSTDGVKWENGGDQGPLEGGPQQVSAELSALQPNTPYQVRIHAENVGGEATAQLPSPAFTTQAAPPQPEASEATHVLTDSAQLNGRVNPRNLPTTYYFRWGALGDCASNPCASAPISQSGDAGSGSSSVFVNVDLIGLSPATTYHYRLVAVNAAGEASSEDVSFTTSAVPGPCSRARFGLSRTLPDCRAYEMVSPLAKGGADVIGTPLRTYAATDGDAVSYGAVTSFGDSPGSSTSGVQYMSTRQADGWTTHPLSPFQTPVAQPSGFSSSQYTGDFSANLDTGVFRALTPIPGTGGANVAGVPNLYLATGMRTGFPHFQLLSDAATPVPPEESTAPHINLAGASEDFRTVVFESPDNLTPAASGEGNKAYQWHDGTLSLVGVLPDDACAQAPCIAPTAVVGAGALTNLDFGDGTYTNLAHAVSTDGSRVFFTAGGPPLRKWQQIGGTDPGFAGSLYLRTDNLVTVQIDRSERDTPDPNGSSRSRFETATPDGKTALFLSREELVNADTDGSGISLYRYETEAPQGHRLTLIHTGGVTVSHLVAATADASYIYFTGNDNLYVLHGGEVRLIASDVASLVATAGEFNFGEQTSAQGYAPQSEVRMSTNGRRLLFGSITDQGFYAPFTPKTNELYLYEYSSDDLTCVSCREDGGPPTGPATFNGNWSQRIDPGGPWANPGLHNNTPLTDDGRYVFFTSPDSLVPRDTNGRLDAYSYEVESGEWHLLSSGQCNCDSVFLTASPTGRDVFFATRQRLVRADSDNLSDIYDARMDGGIESQNAEAPAECEGDSCQLAPTPPNDPTPASAGFAGAGNVNAGVVRKHKRRHRRKNHRPIRKAKGQHRRNGRRGEGMKGGAGR